MIANQAEETKKLRAALGCGLREAYDAVLKYGSADAALVVLKAPSSQAGTENTIDKMERQSRWYEELRDTRYFVPAENNIGWRLRLLHEEVATAEALDAARMNWDTQVKPRTIG